MTHRVRGTLKQLLGYGTRACATFRDMSARRACFNDLFRPRENGRIIVKLVFEVGDTKPREGGGVAAEVGVGFCCALGSASNKLWRLEGCKAMESDARGVWGRGWRQSKG